VLADIELPDSTPASAELNDTPFFPQEDYQCGPAALATVLVAAGRATTPDALRDEVYIPDLNGSLQIELLAATRRNGRVPYLLEPSLEAVVLMLESRRPVLVLQNLGVRTFPLWHYAVVVGYDIAADEVVLRSGTIERKRMSARSFRRTWDYAGNWGFVVLEPGEIPEHANTITYIDSLATFEELGQLDIAMTGYAAAVERWPESEIAWMGLGNTRYATGDGAAAAQAYRSAIRANPGYLPARNNLASVLAVNGCYDAALAELQNAVLRAEKDSPLLALLDTTMDEVERAADEAEIPSVCSIP
jgi:tetratricopeptide (TPR) repeat protein